MARRHGPAPAASGNPERETDMRYQCFLSAVFASFAAIAIGAVNSPVRADHGDATFDTLYVFGDSSSDDGNFFAEYGVDMHPTFAIYYPTGAFTNGHVWANYLVDSGVADVQDNRAFSGAMTGSYGEPARMDPLTGLRPTGLRTQIDNFAGEIGEDDLVGVWVGFNDYLFGTQFGMDNAPAPSSETLPRRSHGWTALARNISWSSICPI